MITFRSSIRFLSALAAGATICATGVLSAHGQQPKTTEKSEIPGGIEGHVKSVDQDKKKISIVTSNGRERTFSTNDETTMVGPRGGKVRRRLDDPRFHEGMELTIVADGTSAKEIHLGYSRKESGEALAEKPAAKLGTPREKAPTIRERIKARAKAAAKDDDDGDDDEIPGKVKSFDAERHVLVLTLLNGKTRSFILPRDLKVLVKGAASKKGLRDPAIKEGSAVTVIVEGAGGRSVRELQITPPAAATSKKAA
jgi:hypothetical protein